MKPETLSELEEMNKKGIVTNPVAFMELFSGLLECPLVSHESLIDFFLFYFDMSSIKVKFSEKTPFFFTQINTDEKHEINTRFLKIKSCIYEQNLQDQIAFIFVIGRTDYFRMLCRDSLLDLVILDENRVKEIIGSPKLRSEILKICNEQIQVHRLSPYEFVEPVVGKMFYGRDKEIKKLTRETDKNFVITGCRKIGKSSLILNAYHKMKISGSTHTEFIDCLTYKTTKDFVQQLTTRLDIREAWRMRVDKLADFLRRQHKRFHKTITLVLDEVDELLEYDKSFGWPLFSALNSAHNEGHCRFIITGFRKVFDACKHLDSPIYKFMESIPIYELDEISAKSLITQPIRDMGIVLCESQKLIDSISQVTTNNPNLIQFICKKLVEKESTQKKKEISYNDLVAVKKSAEFRNYISDTFIVNSLPLEKLTVFSLLDYKNFTLEDMDKELGKRGWSLTLNELEKLGTNMEMANVFRKKEKFYYFSNPLLPEILKEDYDRNFIIQKLLKEVGK